MTLASSLDHARSERDQNFVDALYTSRQIANTRTLHGGLFSQLTAIFDDFQHRSRVLIFRAVVVGDTWSGRALDSLQTPRKWKNLPPPPGFDNLRVICFSFSRCRRLTTCFCSL